MQNDSQSFVPWEQISLIFTAAAPSEILNFFPVGTGQPPFILLAGISLTPVPEPQSYTLLIPALLGVLAARRVQKKRV